MDTDTSWATYRAEGWDLWKDVQTWTLVMKGEENGAQHPTAGGGSFSLELRWIFINIPLNNQPTLQYLHKDHIWTHTHHILLVTSLLYFQKMCLNIHHPYNNKTRLLALAPFGQYSLSVFPFFWPCCGNSGAPGDTSALGEPFIFSITVCFLQAWARLGLYYCLDWDTGGSVY